MIVGALYLWDFFLCLVESLLGGFEAYNFAFAADMEVWQPFYT